MFSLRYASPLDALPLLLIDDFLRRHCCRFIAAMLRDDAFR